MPTEATTTGLGERIDAVEELRESLGAFKTLEALLAGDLVGPQQVAQLLRIVNASFADSLARAKRAEHAARGEA